jgi:hypothetical protein
MTLSDGTTKATLNIDKTIVAFYKDKSGFCVWWKNKNKTTVYLL